MGFCHVPGTGLGSGGALATQSDTAETLRQQIIPSWYAPLQLHSGAGACAACL